MTHQEQDRKHKKTKVIVTCTACHIIFFIRRDASRPRYRQYRKIGPIKCTTCLRKSLSLKNKTQVGSKNPNWKGGKTSSIQKFYASSEWKLLRQQTFDRDNYTCQDCKRRGGKLEANHIKPRWKFSELRLVLSNLETLCKPCHNKKKWLVYADFT
jgi:5-methylcytosine-specific restriction endonuclease McrA